MNGIEELTREELPVTDVEAFSIFELLVTNLHCKREVIDRATCERHEDSDKYIELVDQPDSRLPRETDRVKSERSKKPSRFKTPRP